VPVFVRGPRFVHLHAGEEASAVGVCMHLTDSDTIASTLMLMSAMAEGDRVTLTDLPGDLATPVISPPKTLPTHQRLTRDLLIATLKRHKWCVTRSAEELDLSRSTIHRKMVAWQINSPNHQNEVH
jgi:transcriptional regulator with GAF, ATPase, and Fis domain